MHGAHTYSLSSAYHTLFSSLSSCVAVLGDNEIKNLFLLVSYLQMMH